MSTLSTADVAESVRAKLAAGTYSQSFVPVRSYLAVYSLEDLETLRVTVIGSECEETLATRAQAQRVHVVDVAVQKLIDMTSNTAADALMTLCEEIKDALRKVTMCSGAALWMGTEQQMPIAEHLAQNQVFTSVLRFRYREIR